MAADEVHDELEALEAIFLEGGFEVDESRAEPGCLPTLRIRLRTTDGDGACSPWLWLEVDRPEDYPELPAKVRVVADSKVRWIPNCHLAALADVGKQVAHAQAGEVSVYAVYDAVSEAVLDVLGDIDGPGGDAGGCSPPLNPAPKNELAEKAAVDSKSGEAAAAAPTPAPQGQSSDMLGVSLRFILNFAARHRVGGFGKWEAPCEEHTTGSVCIRVVKPATKSQHVAFTSLGPPHIAEGETSPPTHFVSHSWGCPFASLATSLLVHQLGHDVAWAMLEDVVDLHKLSSRLEHELSRGEVPEYFYWIDVFAKNQHVVESDATAAELASMVNAVSIGAVMVIHPLREPRMLSRVWCLFEMHQAMVLGRELSGVPSFDGMLELHSVMEKERKAREVSPGKSRDGEVRRTSSGPDRRWRGFHFHNVHDHVSACGPQVNESNPEKEHRKQKSGRAGLLGSAWSHS